jgi:hypothetical protein
VTIRQRILPLLAASFIAIYFLALVHDARHAYFTLDDVANLYRAWYYPLGALVKANFLFFLTTPFLRALGSAWYRLIFYFGGFNPVPFHVANVLILAANLGLTYAVSRRLSGSREVGALTALLFAYHPRFAYIYFDTGYVYDVLCYFFYFSAFLFYIRVRQQERVLSAWELAGCSALYICALNSKQMAVTLPVFLVVYEVLYHRVRFRMASDVRRWLAGEGRFVMLSGLLTLTFLIGQSRGPDSLLLVDAYRPVFTWDRFITTSRNFVSELFFQRHVLPAISVLSLWTGLLAIAWIAKSRSLKFAWMFLMFSVIPIAFIDRGTPQYYISLFGWVLYAAIALVDGSRLLVGRLFRGRQSWIVRARGPVLFVGLGLLMYPLYRGTGWSRATFVSLEGEGLRRVVDQMRRLRPVVRPSSRLLFVNDPLGPNDLDLMFLVRLAYRDATLVVGRMKAERSVDEKVVASYDYVFDYRQGRFYSSVQHRLAGPQPEIVFEWGQLGVFHQGWERVTEASPAKAGEVVIAMVTDLGETKPPVPPGQPFPKAPFADVTSPVEVRVGGQPAEVTIKFGWPDQVNRYRVDFRIPERVQHGEAAVVIAVRDVTGPPVEMPVQ